MDGNIGWLERLAYGLRVVAGWYTGLRLLFMLFRQGCALARVLRRCSRELRKAGISVGGRPPGLVRTPLQHYWRLMQAMPFLAHDEAAYWAQHIRNLHEQVRKASYRGSDVRKVLNDPEARDLQFMFLRRFFQERLRIELRPPADAFARYQRGSDALCDFFDFCASRERLTSREEVEKAIEDFAELVKRYRVTHSGSNPPRDYFLDPSHVRPRFWTWRTRLLFPGRLLAHIYWGKNHLQRVFGGLAIPPWVYETIANGLKPPAELPLDQLQSVLAYEMCLCNFRYLAQIFDKHGTAGSQRLILILQRATMDTLDVARFHNTNSKQRVRL